MATTTTDNSLRDRRNSTAPDGLVGSPKWRMLRTNLTRFLSRQVGLFTREMKIKCALHHFMSRVVKNLRL